MKALTTFFFATIMSLSVYSQKCKYNYEKDDPFTGNHIVGITETISRSWKIVFTREKDNYSISLVIKFRGVMEDVVGVNDTLLIALEGTKPISLCAAAVSNPTTHLVYFGDYAQYQTSYLVAYQISTEQLEILSNNKPISTRVYIGKNFYTVNIKKGNSKKIAKAAACILQ